MNTMVHKMSVLHSHRKTTSRFYPHSRESRRNLVLGPSVPLFSLNTRDTLRARLRNSTPCRAKPPLFEIVYDHFPNILQFIQNRVKFPSRTKYDRKYLEWSRTNSVNSQTNIAWITKASSTSDKQKLHNILIPPFILIKID